MRIFLIICAFLVTMIISSKSDTQVFEGEPVERISPYLDKYIHSQLAVDECEMQRKFSDDHKTIAILIYRKENGGSNYAFILIIHTNADQSSVNWNKHYLPLQTLKNESQEIQAIDEIETIDNEATKITLKIDTIPSKVPPFRDTPVMQTREIPSGRIVETKLRRTSTINGAK